MKFGKRLRSQMERTLPEWRDKFICYKELKKQIRPVADAPPASFARRRALRGFVRLLHSEVDKINAFFLEREEDLVIRHKELLDKIAAGGDSPQAADLTRTRRSIVDLHGEMVLLLNYSAINYTALAKIMKKYDKRTGERRRPVFIEGVLAQPFFATELVSGLVKDCELAMESALQSTAKTEPSSSSSSSLLAGEKKSFLFKNAVAALVTMRELRRASSTRGLFSLPPLSPADADLLQALQLPSPIPIR
ncbi:SPX domain protein 3 [Wolffia australiana]